MFYQSEKYSVQHTKNQCSFETDEKKYGLKCVKNLSTHSLRKTFGRHIYECTNGNGEMALVMLSELFNHSNISITKRYLGLRKKEILRCYDLLDF